MADFYALLTIKNEDSDFESEFTVYCPDELASVGDYVTINGSQYRVNAIAGHVPAEAVRMLCEVDCLSGVDRVCRPIWENKEDPENA